MFVNVKFWSLHAAENMLEFARIEQMASCVILTEKTRIF